MGQRQQSETLPSLETAGGEVQDGDFGNLFTNFTKLSLQPSIKLCRTKGEAISNKTRLEMIKNSLIILQAYLGRDKPSNAEFEVCAQNIVRTVPELKDALPPIRTDALKQWVGYRLSLLLHCK